jgi:hypothetical protein
LTEEKKTRPIKIWIKSDEGQSLKRGASHTTLVIEEKRGIAYYPGDRRKEGHRILPIISEVD